MSRFHLLSTIPASSTLDTCRDYSPSAGDAHRLLVSGCGSGGPRVDHVGGTVASDVRWKELRAATACEGAVGFAKRVSSCVAGRCLSMSRVRGYAIGSANPCPGDG